MFEISMVREVSLFVEIVFTKFGFLVPSILHLRFGFLRRRHGCYPGDFFHTAFL